jgi:hypothetical protein
MEEPSRIMLGNSRKTLAYREVREYNRTWGVGHVPNKFRPLQLYFTWYREDNNGKIMFKRCIRMSRLRLFTEIELR